LGYKIHKHGLNFYNYGLEKSDDISGAVQASSPKRRGRLEFPDDGFSWENVRTFIDWIWVWMK
jgi:amino acid transporter